MEIRMGKIGVKETPTDCNETDCAYNYHGLCGYGLSKKTENCMDTAKPKVMMMPAPPDKCQECAVHHDPVLPHNKDSLFYQYHFYAEHNRWPTWKDAMAHCSQEMKDTWIKALAENGVEVEE